MFCLLIFYLLTFLARQTLLLILSHACKLIVVCVCWSKTYGSCAFTWSWNWIKIKRPWSIFVKYSSFVRPIFFINYLMLLMNSSSTSQNLMVFVTKFWLEHLLVISIILIPVTGTFDTGPTIQLNWSRRIWGCFEWFTKLFPTSESKTSTKLVEAIRKLFLWAALEQSPNLLSAWRKYWKQYSRLVIEDDILCRLF